MRYRGLRGFGPDSPVSQLGQSPSFTTLSPVRPTSEGIAVGILINPDPDEPVGFFVWR